MKIFLTVLISTIIFSLAILILFLEIRKRKQGKPSCSCGGSCGSCPVGCCDIRKTKEPTSSDKSP